MKWHKSFRTCVVALSCVGFLTAQIAQAAGPVPASTTGHSPVIGAGATVIRDVALQSDGVLKGQVVDAQGTPQARVQIAIRKQGELPRVATSDANGLFCVGDLSGGVYEIYTATGGGAYRLWAPRTAPPAAQDNVLLVTGNDVVLGQNGGVLGFLANPWVIGLIVAAAIAIPLALDNPEGS